MPRVTKHDAASPRENIYDAQGRLLASAVRVAWFPVPRGFTRSTQGYGRHVVFEAHDVPLAKVRDYLARHMLTGEVNESSGGVFYRAVMPIDSNAEATRLNVHLAARARDARVELDIEPLTYGDVKPLKVEDAKKVLQEEARHAE